MDTFLELLGWASLIAACTPLGLGFLAAYILSGWNFHVKYGTRREEGEDGGEES